MAEKKIKWLGSTKCDICHAECKHILYDGRTVYGPWAVMCVDCFVLAGRGTGTGFGQRYEKNDKGEFVKVAG